MTMARSKLVDESKSGVFHLVNRCVRRGFLLGHECDHRRDWLQEQLRAKTAIFAIDVLAYAIMDNHFHLIIKTQPERAADWDEMEVARRWTTLCPPKDLRGQPVRLKPDELQALIAQPGWVKERRRRLSSMSWLMKLIKEKLARQANREDKVTGHFWEGRFHSVPLLDPAAVLAGMVYVDLNPIRAGVAQTPEESDHTSVQERILLMEEAKLPRRLRRAGLQEAGRSTDETRPDEAYGDSRHLREMCGEVLRRKARRGIKPWVAPIKDCAPGATGECGLTLEQYLTLVDQTARQLRPGKRGAMDRHAADILERLGLDGGKWIEAMARGGQFRGRAVGSPEARTQHLVQRGGGEKWIADKTPIYAESDAPGATAGP